MEYEYEIRQDSDTKFRIYKKSHELAITSIVFESRIDAEDFLCIYLDTLNKRGDANGHSKG